MNWIYVAAGGALGAMARYGACLLLTARGTSFPLATFTVNMVGCFLMGAVIEAFTQKALLSPEVKLLLATGFLGAFTTFSTFSLENIVLLQREAYLRLTLYTAGSVGVGMSATAAGMYLVRAIMRQEI